LGGTTGVNKNYGNYNEYGTLSFGKMAGIAERKTTGSLKFCRGDRAQFAGK